MAQQVKTWQSKRAATFSVSRRGADGMGVQDRPARSPSQPAHDADGSASAAATGVSVRTFVVGPSGTQEAAGQGSTATTGVGASGGATAMAGTGGSQRTVFVVAASKKSRNGGQPARAMSAIGEGSNDDGESDNVEATPPPGNHGCCRIM